MTKRKNVGKSQDGVFQRIGQWITGSKSPTIEEAYINNSGRSVSDFSDTYNDTALSGDRYVNGQCCKTVGEYKAACERVYGPQ